MRRGEARLIFLDVLRQGPRHGYEIIRIVEERSGGQYVPSPGTVYPTLQYLEEAEWIASESDGERRVYRLTDKGQSKLEAHQREVEDFWNRFSQPPCNAASLHELDFLHQEMRELERTVMDGVRFVLDFGRHDSLRSIRQVVQDCKNRVRDIIADPLESGRREP